MVYGEEHIFGRSNIVLLTYQYTLFFSFICRLIQAFKNSMCRLTYIVQEIIRKILLELLAKMKKILFLIRIEVTIHNPCHNPLKIV